MMRNQPTGADRRRVPFFSPLIVLVGTLVATTTRTTQNSHLVLVQGFVTFPSNRHIVPFPTRPRLAGHGTPVKRRSSSSRRSKPSCLFSTSSDQIREEHQAQGPQKDDNDQTTTESSESNDSIAAVPGVDYVREFDRLSSLLQPQEETDTAAAAAAAAAAMEPETNDNTIAGRELNNVNDDTDHDNNDKYVFVGNRQQMMQDPVLQQVSSEILVQRQFQKVDDKGLLEDFPLDLLLERAWDTVEDVLVHMRRIPYEKGWLDLEENDNDSVMDHDDTTTTTTTNTPQQLARRRKTVVILGSGWAAHALMKIADCTKFRLVVISPSNHFVFTPMLASAAVGTVEYRSMTEAVRAANPLIHDYIEGRATDVNVQNKTITVQLNNLLQGVAADTTAPPLITMAYDHLVCAVGCQVSDRGVPGAEHTLRLKSTDDARKLRTAVGECFEYASRPNVAPAERARRVTFLIVGGGPTGVELAGELVDLFADVTRAHKGTYPKLKDSVRVVLAHGGNELVPQFEPALRKEALKALERKGVEVLLNTRVTEVSDDVANAYAKLSTKVKDPVSGMLTNDREERTLPVGLTVWCAGTAPVPFVETMLSQLPQEARYRDGRVRVDRWMRPPMPDGAQVGSLFVLGDAAAADYHKGSDGSSSLLPSTAQVAGQQGAFVARLLDRDYDLTQTPPQLTTTNVSDDRIHDPSMTQWLKFRGLESAPPFGFLNLGMLAYLGGGEALSQIQVGDVNLLAWAGSVAFLLWRSVYLVKQVATRNRVLVTFDWIKSSIFGRDITRL